MKTITVSLLMIVASGIAGFSQGVETNTTTLPQSLTAENQKVASREPSGIWERDIGQGFRAGTQTLSFEVGGVYGVAAFGSREAHHMALASVSYGYMLGGIKAPDHWYRGNWEIRGELFGGEQFEPSTAYLVGLTPHLRYNFATGSRFIPFLDIGAGATVTDIGRPDLSGIFQFNLQANIGVHWFVSKTVAVTAEAGYLHLSCAGISEPNLGVNGVRGLLGVTWFF